MGVRKEQLVSALEHRAPSRHVPLWELHFHLWNAFSGGGFVSGRDYLNLSTAERDRALHRDALIMIQVADHLGFSGVTIPDSPWDCVYTLPPEDRLVLAGYLRAESPDFLIIAGCGGVMAIPDSPDYVEFCYRLMDAPDEVEKQCEAKLQNGLQSLQRYADCGIEAAYVAADMADNRGPFFSGSQMDRFILPYLARWTEGARKAGILPILHTDGNVMDLLEDLAATGICGIQALDPVAGMDIGEVKAAMGNRLCLCGNVDCGALIRSSPAQIHELTKDLLLSCKPGGCFVLGASNAVVDGTPKENYEAMVRAWRENGSYRSP